MRVVIQRVKQAQVCVRSEVVGKIGKGLLVFLSVQKDDTAEEADYLVQKIPQLRVFDDDAGKMNVSSLEAGTAFLIVSQFTLHGSCEKGRRPSFDRSAEPKKAEELYNYFIDQLRDKDCVVETGQFRAMMDVSLINDGPVTFIIDSPNEKNR